LGSIPIEIPKEKYGKGVWQKPASSAPKGSQASRRSGNVRERSTRAKMCENDMINGKKSQKENGEKPEQKKRTEKLEESGYIEANLAAIGTARIKKDNGSDQHGTL